MEKTLAEQKDLLFLALCAFIEDGYAHCSISNLNTLKIGEKNIKELLHRLEIDGKISNQTVNGFYRRYKIMNPEDCPDFIFNTNLTLTNKLFILYCLNNLKDISHRPARQLALDLRDSEDYTFESKQLTQIKKAIGCTLFDYLKKVTTIKKTPFHEKYNLIKTENGYQVDTYPERDKELTKEEKNRLKQERILQRLISEGVGNYLMHRVQHRMKQNPERFSYTDLTIEYLNNLYIKQEGKDFYTKLPFRTLREVSVDRIDSSKLYTTDNIVLTSQTINVMKGTLETNEFISICKQIAQAN